MAETAGATEGPCPDCGSSWPATVRFCGACGAAVQADAGGAVSGPGAASAASRARPVLVIVGAVMGVGLVVGMVASVPRASTTEEATFDPGAVGLAPGPLPARGAPTSPDVLMEVTAVCPQAPTSDCVRWVRPGPQGRWLGAAPVTASQDAGVLVVGDQDQVRALDLDTGARRWAAAASGNVVVARAVGDKVVLVQDDAGVRALDLRDGDVRWAVAHAAVVVRPPDASPVGQALVVSRTRAVTSHEVGTGDPIWSITEGLWPASVVPLGEEHLLLGTAVVEAATGRPIWDLQEVSAQPRVVAASGDRLVVLEGDGARPVPVLRAAATGEEVARLDLDAERVRVAVVVGSHLVVRLDDETVAFDLADGTEAWRRRIRGELLEAPTAAGPADRWPGVVVPAPALAVRRTDGSIVVLDHATGQVRLRVGEPDPEGIDLGGGMVAGARVYRIDEDRLQVFDLATGELQVDAAVRSPTIVRTDPLVVLSERHLIRLDPVVS